MPNILKKFKELFYKKKYKNNECITRILCFRYKKKLKNVEKPQNVQRLDDDILYKNGNKIILHCVDGKIINNPNKLNGLKIIFGKDSLDNTLEIYEPCAFINGNIIEFYGNASYCTLKKCQLSRVQIKMQHYAKLYVDENSTIGGYIHLANERNLSLTIGKECMFSGEIAIWATYNTDLIWDNLLRTQKGSTLKRNLHLNYFLDENNYLGDEKILKNNLKVAMLCYCYYPDMVEYCYNYAKNLPSWVDIYVFVVDKNTADEFMNKFSGLPNNIEVRIKENRGQLASTILISGKDIFEKYDLVCVTQAKKTSQLRDQFASENYCEHCWQGVLKSPAYVLNLIQAYYDNPRMGYSCNFIPHWQAFLNLPTNELTANKTLMEKLFKNFELNVPFDDEPIASYGECYWVRSKGYKKILAHHWKHSDFPEASQTPKDGSILNALERMMPLFVQDMGFYASWIVPMSYASIYFDNIYHLYRLEKLKTKQNLSITNKVDIQIHKDVFHFNNLLLKYWVSKILYKLCIGNYRRKNKQKSKEYKIRIKAVKSLRKRILGNI